MPGRKKKPTRLKLIQGNPGKRPINKNEPKPTSIAEIPDWLQDDPLAVEEWNRLAPELTALGILTSLDQTQFAIYCDAVGRFGRNRVEIEAEGDVIAGKRGGFYQSPHLSILRRERDAIKVFGSLFGLSPSDRVGLEVDLVRDREGDFGAELLDD